MKRSLALFLALAMALAFVPVVMPTANAAMSHTVVTSLEITARDGGTTKNYYLPLDVVPSNTSGSGFIYEVSVMGIDSEYIEVNPTIATSSSLVSWQASGTGVASRTGGADTPTFAIDAGTLPTANGTAQLTLNLTGEKAGAYTIRFQSVTAITVDVTGDYGTNSGNWVYLADFSDVPVAADGWATASLGSSYQVLDEDVDGSRTFVVNRTGNDGQYDKRVRVAVVPGDGYYVKSFKDGGVEKALTRSNDGSFQYYLIGTNATTDLASALHAITVEFAEKTVSIGDISAALIVGTASTATYPVTTTDFTDGTTGTIKWYDAASPSSLTATPIGITIEAGAVSSDEATLTVTATEDSVAGDYYFTVTYDGVESARKTLTVAAAPVDPGTSVDVTSEAQLTDALTAGKTDITITGDIELTNVSTEIPAGTKLTIASNETLSIPEGKTLSIYGTLVLESGAKVSIAGALEFGYSATITSNGGTLELDGGVIRFVPDTVTFMAFSVSDDITALVKKVLAILSATSDGGTVEIGADQGVVFDNVVTIPSNVTLNVDGELNVLGTGSLTLSDEAALVLNNGATSVIEGTLEVEAGAEVTIASGGALDLSGATGVILSGEVNVDGDLTVGSSSLTIGGTINIGSGVTVDLSNAAVISSGGTIVLAPGATLEADSNLSGVTVKDFADNTLTPGNDGNYTVDDYAIAITRTDGGMGVSFEIEVSNGVNSSDLYLIAQSTVEAEDVSLVMIAVGAYNAGNGYSTHASYRKADQVDVWLVYDSSGAPDWTEANTGMYLQTKAWSESVTP